MARYRVVKPGPSVHTIDPVTGRKIGIPSEDVAKYKEPSILVEADNLDIESTPAGGLHFRGKVGDDDNYNYLTLLILPPKSWVRVELLDGDGKPVAYPEVEDE